MDKYTTEQIAALLAARTPGEWRVTRSIPEFGFDVGFSVGINDLGGDRGLMFRRLEDAEFIAAAPAIVAQLLRRVEELEADNGRLRDGLTAFVDKDAIRDHHGLPGGYIDMSHSDSVPPGKQVGWFCTYCYSHWYDDEPERHDDDCEVAIGRKVLQAESEARNE